MLKRYRLTQTPESRYATMEEHKDGEFIRWEDHQKDKEYDQQLIMSYEIIEKIKGEENGRFNDNS